MLAEKLHSHFQSLYDFPEATARYHEHSSAVWDLGQVICRHNLEDVIGVALLHKHFDIAEGEQVVRRYQKDSVLISPKAFSDEYVGCVWAYSEFSDTGFLPIEFCQSRPSSEASGQVDVVSRRPSFVNAFRDRVVELGVERLFGFSILCGIQLSDPDSDRAVVERSIGQRRLRLEMISKDILSEIESTETLWKFSRADSAGATACPVSTPGSEQSTWRHCYHCTAHCPTRCR